MIDLKKFCSKNPEFSGILTPFTQIGKTWATNGWLVVGIPALESIPDRDDAPRISKIISATPPAEEWFDVPHVVVHACEFCNGKIVNFRCFECGGEGVVNFENKFTKYNGIYCESCNGEGDVNFCPNCSGTGVFADEMVEIGKSVFAANAINFIVDLPGVQISPTGKETPTWLKFDGGVGFIMPAKDNGKRQ